MPNEPPRDEAYWLAQAQKCRHLAKDVTDEKAITTLLAMADEYEAEAARLHAPPMDGVPHPKMDTPPE